MLMDEFGENWRALHPEGIEKAEEKNCRPLNDRKLCVYYLYYEKSLNVIEIVTDGNRKALV